MKLLNSTTPLLAFAMLACLSGCTVCEYAKLLSYSEPAIYSQKKDRKASLATYRSLADEAWATKACECPEGFTFTDYQWGFREGFAQYVYAGGDGEPPAVPPRVYWQVDMRTAEGAAAVRSWFEGYRHGARIAKYGGYREAATVEVSASLKDCTPCGCPDDGSGQACCPSEGPAIGGPVEQLLAPEAEPELAPAPESNESEQETLPEQESPAPDLLPLDNAVDAERPEVMRRLPAITPPEGMDVGLRLAQTPAIPSSEVTPRVLPVEPSISDSSVGQPAISPASADRGEVANGVKPGGVRAAKNQRDQDPDRGAVRHPFSTMFVR